MAKVEFNVNVKMEERWIPHFQSFLHYMESMGKLGHSCVVGFYSDGDGDFRPEFSYDIPVNIVDGIENEDLLSPEVIFDAG